MTTTKHDVPYHHVVSSDAVTPASMAHIAHCPECMERFGGSAGLALPRERWHFAGREHTAEGLAYYVWHLRNLDGSVNSAWVYPVELMLRSWVSEREGE